MKNIRWGRLLVSIATWGTCALFAWQDHSRFFAFLMGALLVIFIDEFNDGEFYKP